MDQAIGILGQAVLILVGLALVFFLVFAILLMRLQGFGVL
jgi:hypothetical protein